jgi:uncharacterized protein (TIGR02147 family)
MGSEPKQTKIKKPSVYQFSNYRDYLKAIYNYKKNTTLKRFSLKDFNHLLNFSSHDMLNKVMHGKRNLSQKSAMALANGLGLSKRQAEFFKTLVLLNQAESIEERRFYTSQILKFNRYKKLNPLNDARFRLFSKWFYTPVLQLISLKEFQEDPAWIAKKLVPHITEAEAKSALKDLESLGLIFRNEKGRLRRTNKSITTENELTNALIPQFHKQMIERAKESIDAFDKTERNISGATLAVSPDKLKEIWALMHKYREEVLLVASQSEKVSDIIQVNFQLFPLIGDSK